MGSGSHCRCLPRQHVDSAGFDDDVGDGGRRIRGQASERAGVKKPPDLVVGVFAWLFRACLAEQAVLVL